MNLIATGAVVITMTNEDDPFQVILQRGDRFIQECPASIMENTQEIEPTIVPEHEFFPFHVNDAGHDWSKRTNNWEKAGTKIAPPPYLS